MKVLQHSFQSSPSQSLQHYIILVNMALHQNVIPVIDISSLWNIEDINETQQTIKSIAEACRDYGFLYVKNHGVAEQIQDNVFQVLKNFFALPGDVKEQIKSKGTDNFRGYFEFQSEITAYLKGSKPDWREGFYASVDIPDDQPCKKMFPLVTGNNKWPKEPADFRQAVEVYYQTLKKLAFKIMGALAVGLGLKEDFFDEKFCPYPMVTLGMYHYLPHPNVVGPDEINCGEHTDYGILTILMQDDIGGLEIYDDNGQWIPVPPIPGTFVINLGDMLEVWTNGMYKATKHRVTKKQNSRDRLSVACFFNPNLETVVNPIELEKPLISLKNRKPNSNIKIPVIFGEFLEEKYRGTFSQHMKSSEMD